MALTREEVLCRTQKLARELGTERFLPATFVRRMAGEWEAWKEYFTSASECLSAAGLQAAKPDDWTNEQIFDAMLRAFLQNKTWNGPLYSFVEHLPFEISLIHERFGGWACARRTALEYARKKLGKFHTFRGFRIMSLRSAKKVNPAPLLGPLLRFRNMEHEPVNEWGVVLLFGHLSAELGFQIDTARAQYPDCEARRELPDRSGYQRVRIEFEYRSANFRKHGHDLGGCDLIVCWIDDWADCPLEVLVLSKVVAQIRAREEEMCRQVEEMRMLHASAMPFLPSTALRVPRCAALTE